MEIIRHKNDLVAVFTDERQEDCHWLQTAIAENGEAIAGKAFYVSESSVVEKLSIDNKMAFKIGHLSGKYWEMDKKVVGIDYNLFLSVGSKWKRNHFVAEKGVKILPIFNGLVSGDVYIGGDEVSAIPYNEYDNIIRKIPSYTELSLYVRARIYKIVSDYVDIKGDAVKKYDLHLNKKLVSHHPSPPEWLLDAEIKKFDYFIDRLNDMLNKALSFSENQWQNEILSIIHLIFPKYIGALNKIQIYDLSGIKREIDIGLIDVEGNIDIIEIKKPFDECIVSTNLYRDNHIPRRELSGTIMQVEKYIYYLQRGGKDIDRKIQIKYRDKIPSGITVKIVNPRGIIIMGRSNNLSAQQKNDFEVVKRKYNNIADIITYDDLIHRVITLKNSIRNVIGT